MTHPGTVDSASVNGRVWDGDRRLLLQARQRNGTVGNGPRLVRTDDDGLGHGVFRVDDVEAARACARSTKQPGP
jgi:hypothetical protein